MDAYEIQKRRKQEQKDGLKNINTPSSSNDDLFTVLSVFGAVLFFGFGLAIYGIVSTGNDHKNKLNECESIGGEYIVVDQKSGFRSVIDVYGCVK